MDSVGRLLLRFLLVPLGYMAAVIAGAVVILLGAGGTGGTAYLVPHGEWSRVIEIGFMVGGPVMLMSTVWLPGAIGIILAEAFALRSWVYHVANGVISAWFGWQLFGYPHVAHAVMPLNDPLLIVAEGIAAGFAYWAVAGFSAGFWKPVFRRPPSTDIATAR
jgi:hypothetical protein